MDIHELSRPVSSLAFWERKNICVPLRRLFFNWWSAYKAAAILSLICGTVSAANYTFSIYSTDPALYADLIARATNQYEGTLKKSTFANMYTLTVTAKKPHGPPPITPVPIETGTAFDRCFVHGWMFGSESERHDIQNILNGLQYDISKSTSCGGQVVSTSATPAKAFLDGCSTAYNVTRSTVTQRDGLPPTVLVPPFPAPL